MGAGRNGDSDLQRPVPRLEIVETAFPERVRQRARLLDQLVLGRIHGQLVGPDVVGVVLVQGDDLDLAVLPAPALSPPEAVGVLGDELQGDVFERA